MVNWRALRCAGITQDKTIINRTTLRFRPIAPKPTTGGSVFAGSTVEKENAVVSRGRTKRKYVRVRRNSTGCNKGKRRITLSTEGIRESSSATLQLLPDNCTDDGSWCSKVDQTVQIKQDQEADGNPFDRSDLMSSSDLGLVSHTRSVDPTVAIPQNMRAAAAWVTVEYVCDTCMDVRGLGCTDSERIRNLEGDTCPGFISDGSNRVIWINSAFRKMMGQQQSEGLGLSPEIDVCLATQDRLPPYMKALTCQAKAQYTWQKEKFTQMVVPCDAWRMDGGGFAWRLDVKAALSLGR